MKNGQKLPDVKALRLPMKDGEEELFTRTEERGEGT